MEPLFTDSDIPAYTQQPLPAYRHIPLQNPHPFMDVGGHSYGQQASQVAAFSAADWQNCNAYLYAIDLFNHGYWWEAHEQLKPVCIAAGRESEIGSFVQGLIQIGAAQLKRFMQEPKGAQVLTESGVAKLSAAKGVYLGIEVASFLAEVERCLREDRGEFPRIRLVF